MYSPMTHADPVFKLSHCEHLYNFWFVLFYFGLGFFQKAVQIFLVLMSLEEEFLSSHMA